MTANAARLRRAWITASFSFFVTFLSAGASAQPATIVGRVYDPQAQPVGDATVTLVEIRRVTRTAADGSFRFDAVPPRHYHLRAESPRLGFTVGEADVAAGETRTVEVVIDPLVHAEEIIVTANAGSRRASEVYQPVNVLSEEDLQMQVRPTIGETLAQEPGVASTSFGAGASRPVIRGLGADRIRVLEEGIGTGDVSNVSPDHAVSVDPAGAEQIEIVRGPATLLYGSNAVGGVVNVISERIPSRLPAGPIAGSIEQRFGSAAAEKTTTALLDGAAGQFAWHTGFSLRDTNDYEIPGPADALDDPDHFEGVLENSSLQSRSTSLGGSWIGERGFLGFGVTDFTTGYGVPGHAHHHGEEEDADEEDEAPPVRVDLERRRFDLRGELAGLGLFQNARTRIGITDYRHLELEGAEVGTRFENDAVEARLEADHRPFGRVQGTWGVQTTSNDFEAFGEEAYIPPNTSRSAAVFAFEEIPGERFDFQFGARYERQSLAVDAPGLPDRDFGGLSGSAGTIWKPTGGTIIALSLARAVRLPTATELYANGPHAATRQFEIGNPDLDDETSLGLDLSIRRIAGRFRGEINLFNNSFDGYIYDSPTGETADEFPVYQFVQRDARFRGFEVVTHTHLVSWGGAHVELDLGGDYVRATLRGGENLPRIPPMRLSAGLQAHGGPLQGRVEVRKTFAQNDVAPGESSSDGYTMFDAHLGYRFFVRETIHDVMLRGTNLTNQLARSHVSPLKDLAPLPGRDVSLSYRISF